MNKRSNFYLNHRMETLPRFGKRIGSYYQEGQIQARSHFFWNSPLPLWDLPKRSPRRSQNLLFVDQQRRCQLSAYSGGSRLGFHNTFSSGSGLPASSASSSANLKGRNSSGADSGSDHVCLNQDPKWLVDGKWGVIHYSPGR